MVEDRRAGSRGMYQLDPEGGARLRAHFDVVWKRALGAFQRAAMAPAEPALAKRESAKRELTKRESGKRESGKKESGKKEFAKRGETHGKDSGRGGRPKKDSGSRAH